MKREALGPATGLGLGTRIRLVLLVVLLPGLAYIVVTSVLEHQRARTQDQSDLLRLARLAVAEEKQSLADLQNTLALVAGLDPVQASLQEVTPNDCYTRLADVTRLLPAATSFVVWNLAGGPACPSATPGHPDNAAGQAWFLQAVATRAFSMGDFQLNGGTGQSFVTAGYPVIDRQGNLIGVVSASLDLSQLTQTAGTFPLPSDAVLTVFDHNGMVLARSADAAIWAGKRLPDPAGLAAELSNDPSVAERPDVDGVLRLAAFAPITGPGGNLVYLSIGRPAVDVYSSADTALAVGLIITGALTLLALVLAGLWSRQTVVRPMQDLLATTDRLARGDLDARARRDTAASEVDGMAGAVNVLAESMAQSELRRVHAEKRLAETAGELRRSQAHAAQLEAVAAGLTAASTPAEVTEVILRQGASAAGAASATLLLLSADGQWLRQLAHAGQPDPIDRLFAQYPVSSPLPAADVVRTGEAVWIEGAAAYHARYPQLMDVISATDYEAAVAVPVRGAGRLMGVMVLSFAGELAATSELANYFATLASLCTLGLERVGLLQGNEPEPQPQMSGAPTPP